MISARQRAAPEPPGTCGRDRGTTRHACAAPLRLGSTWGRGVRRPRAGTDPVDPCRTCPPAQRARFLPAIARGELAFAIGMSEPDSGSDLASIRTRAERVPGGYRVNGTKVWTSNAHLSDYMIALFRTHHDPAKKHEGLTQFLVDTKLAGITINPIIDLAGSHHFNMVVFEDVFLPEEMRVGEEGAGWRQVTTELALERSGPERYLSSLALLVELIREAGKEPGERPAAVVGRLVAHLVTLRQMSLSLADIVARLFTERVTRELRQSAETDVWPDALWAAVEENGLTLPLVPEAQGGAGSTWGDAHVVVSAAGRHAVPLPLPETIVAAWLLAGVGLDVPAGPLTLAPAQRDDDLRVRSTTGGFRLDGTARRVPWGAVARHVVVVAAVDGHTLVARAAAGSFRVEPDRNLAREPRDTLVFDATPVAAAPAGVGVPPDAVWQYGALVRAAQIAGGVDAILKLATRYATERRQFGKPIGAYQAIQQNLAVLAGHAAAADIAAAHAFRAADRGDAAFEIGVAKVRTGEAAGITASIAHQVHGALGFTYEHDLQFVTRRLWSWRAEFGGEGWWASSLGRDVALWGADALWPTLTAR